MSDRASRTKEAIYKNQPMWLLKNMETGTEVRAYEYYARILLKKSKYKFIRVIT